MTSTVTGAGPSARADASPVVPEPGHVVEGNLDIPFNPSRLEQRIGRIDRYGQQETPQVFHFAPDRSSSTYVDDGAGRTA